MATCRWLGRAADIQELQTITVANTWAANDVARVTIAGNTVAVTVDSNSTATIAQEIAAAINATSLEGGLISAEVRNVPGQTIPEFTEVEAEASGSTVLVRCKTFGKPFTMTVSETTAGTGTLANAVTTAATGKHFWDNANNWDIGDIPVDGDDIIFESGSVSVLYGLPQSGLDPALFRHHMSYTGQIGLPIVNRDDARYPYPEYRDRYVAIDDNSLNATDVQLGLGEGSGSPMINLSSNGPISLLTINGSGTPQSQLSQYAINLQCNDGTDLGVLISRGSVALAANDGEIFDYEQLVVGFEGSQSSDVSLYIGAGTTIESGGTSLIYGGTVVNLGQRGATTMYGGVLYDEATSSGTGLTIYGGTAYANDSGYPNAGLTIGSSGTVDLRYGAGGCTIASLDLYKGATFLDPHKRATFTAGIDLNQCKLSDVTLDIGPHRRLTLGTPA